MSRTDRDNQRDWTARINTHLTAIHIAIGASIPGAGFHAAGITAKWLRGGPGSGTRRIAIGQSRESSAEFA
jgi:hypothetical protein